MRIRKSICQLSSITFLLWIILFSSGIDAIHAQKAVTLEECYNSAVSANILNSEKNLFTEISSIKDRNISSGWLPSVDFNGSFIYNSDVPDLSSVLGSLPVPGLGNAFQPLPNDQYKLTIEINQVIYDGGAIKSSRELERAGLKVNVKQTEAELYKLKGQVNSVFFNIILLERQKELLENYLNVIEKRLMSVRSAVENGVLTKADADMLLSEQISLSQQISENETRKKSFTKVLASLTGIELTESDSLVLPEYQTVARTDIIRPELQLMDLKKDQLSVGEQLIRSKQMPKAFGFATLGYGNPPGTNFFANSFDTYYIIGAGIKWKIFDWNNAKNERQIISIQKNIIDSRKQDMTETLERQLELKHSEIINLEKLLETDKQLVDLKKSITRSAESQYQNGVITSSEYLYILNSEKQVAVNSEIHKINLALARAEYYNISGTDIK